VNFPNSLGINVAEFKVIAENVGGCSVLLNDYIPDLAGPFRLDGRHIMMVTRKLLMVKSIATYCSYNNRP
jgi:hypothetical protein